MHKKFLIMTAVAAVILAGCSGSSSDSSSKPESASSTESASSASSQQEAQASKNSVKVGETGEADGIKLTVSGTELNAGTEFETPDEGNTFLIVHVQIQNDSDDKLDVSEIDFKLDQNGVERDIDVIGSSLDGVKQLESVTLNNGASIEGDVVFQVPSDYTGGAVLEYYKNSVWDENPIITVTL